MSRQLTIQDVWQLSRPRVGVSGAIDPNAVTNFKKLSLEISTGYDIAGLEPQNGGAGSFVLVGGNWKYRGG